MSFKVTVSPTGHEFNAEPSETLLDAGLRAGLNLDHSCASGSCGDCRAQLVRGRLVSTPYSDYRFTEAEQDRGWFLMCSCRPVTDVEIVAHEVGSVAEIPQQRIGARVSRVEQLQDGVLQLSIRTPRSGGLHFLAGQSVSLGFDGVAEQILPIASCPCDSIQLRFHLRRSEVGDDPFSHFVFTRLRKGTEVVLQGPCGDFTLDEESDRPMVCVAWESGFAPVSSLIDHAIQRDENRSIDLYWLSGISRGHYLSNYCRAWHDVLDDFRYHSIDLEPVGTERIDEVLQRAVRVHSLLADHDYYLALPEPALSVALGFLSDADICPERIHTRLMDRP